MKRSETFKRIGHSQGEKNSQFGSRWMTDGSGVYKVRGDDIEWYLQQGYWFGRK